ncbi:MAG: hypothetical protein V4582_02790 [Pseudomonadota bacterium]
MKNEFPLGENQRRESGTDIDREWHCAAGERTRERKVSGARGKEERRKREVMYLESLGQYWNKNINIEFIDNNFLRQAKLTSIRLSGQFIFDLFDNICFL